MTDENIWKVEIEPEDGQWVTCIRLEEGGVVTIRNGSMNMVESLRHAADVIELK